MFKKIINQLELNNKTILGTGYFSTVLDHNGCALKLTTCDATYSFLKYQKNKNNSNLPKVIDIYGVVGKHKKQNVYSILLEKTFPIYNHNLIIKASQIRNLYRSFLLKSNFDIEPTLENFFWALENFSDSKLLKNFYPDIAKAMKHIHKFVCEYKAMPDLMNPNNYMQNKNGLLIISDPVASTRLFENKNMHEVWKLELLFGSHWKPIVKENI